MQFPAKHILIGLWAVSLSIYSPAQKVSVTFRVNMSKETISPNGVHIAGDFQAVAGFGSDWNPAVTLMSDSNADKIYDVTVKIPAGSYQYKFINDNAWGNNENPPSACSVGNTFNRQITIGNHDLILPAVLYDSCNAMIEFSVDMSNQIVSSNGVHIMGNFQTGAGYTSNWDPASIEMLDLNHDGTYSINLPVIPGQYKYLFINGNLLSDAETPPSNCTIPDSVVINARPANATGITNTLPVYQFNSCDISIPEISTNYKTYWWNDAVFYEIFVRSFYDGNNDGKGDFRGIIDKLDYLNDGDSTTTTDLGITAIWLMPMMPSPSYHGYDVTDYYATNPDYGLMADFQELVTKAHSHGIKVIIDFVMNHTSDQNNWFIQSANSTNGYRNWYVWSNTNPGFLGPWGETVWNSKNGAYYYSLFYSGMPDLNYRDTAVVNEMFNVANFWLGKGVDGFRLDAIGALIEDSTILSDTPETLDLLARFNTSYKAANPDAFTVGEVWSKTSTIVPYVQNKRLDACFEFTLAGTIVGAVNNGDPSGIQSQLDVMQQSYPVLQYGTFLTNHDQDRVFGQLGTDAVKMKQAASIYLTLPGIPFVYYGEELGMLGSGADENKRRPMQWTAGTNSGFSTQTPWEAVGTNYLTNNVETMSSDQASILEHYKKLIRIRHDQAALRRGYLLNVNNADNSILSFARIYKDEAVIVLSNFGSVSTSPLISIPVSSLPAGIYDIKELFSGLSMGTVTLNGNGGFSNWQASGKSLDSKGTWILKLSAQNPNSVPSSAFNNLGLLLYPNPANKEFEVKINQQGGNDEYIEVFTSSGNLVYKASFTGSRTTIQTSDWQTGVYFVKANVNGRSRIERLVLVK
jgi:alpha-amylase